MENVYHTPVLLKESVKFLITKPNGIYVDVTFGGGGHSREILKQIKSGKLIAFDQDLDAVKNIPNNNNFEFIRGNFRYVENYLKFIGIKKIDGLIADLGVSSHHFNSEQRGFSYRYDSHLDLRMNQDAEFDACKLINNYDKNKLIEIFRNYGEIKNANKLANIISSYRKEQKIDTTQKLIEILQKIAPKGHEFKFYAKVFQALRIEVNSELEALKDLLISCENIINKNGRIVFITYHSLEDRLVKNYMKTGNIQGKINKDIYGNKICPFEPINKKVIIPDNNEIAVNSRAKSAKLRIAEKIE